MWNLNKCVEQRWLIVISKFGSVRCTPRTSRPSGVLRGKICETVITLACIVQFCWNRVHWCIMSRVIKPENEWRKWQPQVAMQPSFLVVFFWCIFHRPWWVWLSASVQLTVRKDACPKWIRSKSSIKQRDNKSQVTFHGSRTMVAGRHGQGGTCSQPREILPMSKTFLRTFLPGYDYFNVRKTSVTLFLTLTLILTLTLTINWNH